MPPGPSPVAGAPDQGGDAAIEPPLDPAIDLGDLRVRRGGREVLRGITCAVPVGQVVGLLGPSGSGKSTLIRALVGVQRHVTGRCLVLGRPAGGVELRHRVGYVTQSASVYADLTVSENLRYFAQVLGAARAVVEEVIDQIDLGPERDRLVGSLSGGQVSRVSLGAALLGRPEVLLLDEPTVGLDPVLRRDLWRLFRDLAGAGTTLLVSSHVMDEARECDRLLLLRDGLLLADGTEASLLDHTGAPDIGAAFLQLIEDGARP